MEFKLLSIPGLIALIIFVAIVAFIISVVLQTTGPRPGTHCLWEIIDITGENVNTKEQAVNLFKQYLKAEEIYSEIDETYWQNFARQHYEDEEVLADYLTLTEETIRSTHSRLKERINPDDLKADDFEYLQFGDVPHLSNLHPQPRDDEFVYVYQGYIMISKDGIIQIYGSCPT